MSLGWRAKTANSGRDALGFSSLPAGAFRRLQPQLGDFQSQLEATAFRRWRASLLAQKMMEMANSNPGDDLWLPIDTKFKEMGPPMFVLKMAGKK